MTPAARPADGWPDDLPTLADIVATVDLERALAALGRSPDDTARALDEPLLGARVVVLSGLMDDGPGVLVVAEPSTEGRLAATLARHDEGVVGRYAALPDGEDLTDFGRRAVAKGLRHTAPSEGPFGAAVLVLDRPATGPHLIVVERASLPSAR